MYFVKTHVFCQSVRFLCIPRLTAKAPPDVRSGSMVHIGSTGTRPAQHRWSATVDERETRGGAIP